ncbi:hypothetical protein BD779DRAFT_1610723 [Infundibulicybe gibba]|nr:hypothetical protein BD779DRAFT_1610723 [Infundibulicybe gibba]
MNRRVGAEGIFGIGGGTVSKESQRNLDKAESLCRQKKPEKALPFLLKAIEDNNNLDALIQAAFLFDRPHAIKVLESSEKRGRILVQQELGEDAFSDDGERVGSFWLLLCTRPYMRVLQALVRVYFEDGQFEKSANTIIEMLRLCPGDNLGQRSWLGSLLLHLGRYSDALYFAQQWLIVFMSDGRPPDRGATKFKAPSKELMSNQFVEGLGKYGPGGQLYTAAFASFKLWGDCPLAPSLNMNPRASNGPEDAQDYLWLTQDLWMAEDVWAWVDANPDVRKSILRECSNKRCSNSQVFYCSPACQKAGWAGHKADCLAHKERKEMMRLMRSGQPHKVMNNDRFILPIRLAPDEKLPGSLVPFSRI